MQNIFSLKSLLKKMFLLLLIGTTNINTEAKNLPGFIITENSDTIAGSIKKYLFDRITGNLTFRGINLELYHHEIAFRHEDKSYKTYKPQDILGFSFIYKKEQYTFHRFAIESKSIIKKERKRYRFLHLLYNNNKISLYSDYIRVRNTENLKDTKDLNKPASYKYNDYYLYNTSSGLCKIDFSNGIDSILRLLKAYGMEEDFIDNYFNKAFAHDIRKIFEEYDLWLKLRIIKKK
jgi:hypothetical protein